MGKTKDLTGSKIGKLTVLKRKRENNKTYYYCRCDCKNELWIRADNLKTTRSCGCLAKEMQFKSTDITNRKFNRLTAIKPTDKKDKNNGSVIWECSCICGNIYYASVHDLISGRVKSCGCLDKENSKNNIQKAIKIHLEKHIIQGTNIPVISSKKLKKNNNSGVTGVFWDRSRKKWRAVITFKGEVYNLGRYMYKSDAIEIRKQAEGKLFGEFLKWYKENYKK